MNNQASLKSNIDRLINKLLTAKFVVVFTGAGVSAESGIPTFRDKDGLWQKLKPEELANFNAFLRNPDLVTEWYSHRRKIITQVQPNPGHYAIAEMENLFEQFAVITQNIDNLHRLAGSKRIYELHGNIERNYCIKCKKYYDLKDIFPTQAIHCECGGLIRPDVVWFGELLPEDQYQESIACASSCDVLFSVGTSSVVYPAAYIPIYAKRSGAFLVEVNTNFTEISDLADMTLIGKSGEILPEIVKEFKKRKNLI